MKRIVFLLITVILVSGCGSQSEEPQETHGSIRVESNPTDAKILVDDPEVLTDSSTGLEFVFVKGGCYGMGDTFGDGRDVAKPVHEVCVDDYYIGKTEVTQGQWEDIMGENPSKFQQGKNFPVESVSWYDVQGLVKKLNNKTGKYYRLPTEAEWEYAARSGGKKEKYAGTSNLSELINYAWYGGNYRDGHNPVGCKKPNGLGLYDMSGNVWEWVQDIYSRAAYRKHQRNNPIHSASGSSRVYRGGSWYDFPRGVSASYRGYNTPDSRNYSIGFRLARTQ